MKAHQRKLLHKTVKRYKSQVILLTPNKSSASFNGIQPLLYSKAFPPSTQEESATEILHLSSPPLLRDVGTCLSSGKKNDRNATEMEFEGCILSGVGTFHKYPSSPPFWIVCVGAGVLFLKELGA